MRIPGLLKLFLFSVFGFSFIQQENKSELIQTGAKPEMLADGFGFTEGPTADAKGNIYFTDQPNDRIMIWSIDGKLSTFLQPCGRSNGLSFDKDGNLWACADEKNEIWRIAKDKTVTVLPSKYNGKLLNGPNDIFILSNGLIYFTDPYWQRSWWDHKTMPQDNQGVYCLSSDHKTITRVIDDFVKPNGIVGTPDGKTLFIADQGDKKIWKYKVNKDGSLTKKTLFCERGSDGMTIDSKGNIYLTGRGVTVFDKNGKQIEYIEIPGNNGTTNVCFGDPDLKSLFITNIKGLYRLRMNVKGTTE